MKVLGIAGSPRFGSNTEILLNQVLKGAEDCGAVTAAIRVSTLNIMPCSHCGNCSLSGECCVSDDACVVFDKIEQFDRIVLASPLYFMGLPSQLKTLVDRAQFMWCRKNTLKQPIITDGNERHGLFVSVGSRMGERLFEAAEATVKAFFTSLNIKYVGKIAFQGIDGYAQIQSSQELLKEAFKAGQKLVL